MDEQFELAEKFNPVFYGNLVTGLWVGGYFDLAFGSNKRTDKVKTVDLDCKGKK